MDESVGKGCCRTCGYLCRRDTANLHLAAYYQITERDREVGRWLPPWEAHLSPWCFRGVPISREIQQQAGVVSIPTHPPEAHQAGIRKVANAADEVINRDRACPLWFPYHPGLGPTEHLGGQAARDMEASRQAFLESLEQQRQGFEREMEESRRQFHDGLETQRQGFALETAASRDTFTLNLAEASDHFQRSTRKVTIWLTLAALMLAVAQVIAALAALTCDSLIWIWVGPLGIVAPGCPRL